MGQTWSSSQTSSNDGKKSENTNINKTDGCPVQNKAQSQNEALPSGCPMHMKNNSPQALLATSDVVDPSNMMGGPNQQPSPGQPFELSKERQVSSIPKNSSEKVENWVYPSEQMFWNAMIKKGWRWETSQISQHDMENIIKIHNTNNENAWREILLWEKFAGYDETSVKLVKFSGDAKKYSPRARFRRLLGHDWIIERGGKEVRYILDYYNVTEENGLKNSQVENMVYMDIRPALDSPEAFYTRFKASSLTLLAGAYNKIKNIWEPPISETP